MLSLVTSCEACSKCFGDGSTSSDRNPVHTYASRERFDVLLTVTDDRGATDTKVRHADPKD